ncbi:MAG TPA: NFACT RNA binding domain-containing protein [Longimicrobiales bacterium]|nr:NFACT RNA binding domain-containing protein [Longimicrobiales bacterium]
MPLRWDPLLVRHLAMELDHALAGAHLRALRLDGTSRRLALLLREATLEWDLHPSRGVPRLLPPMEPGPVDLPFQGRVRRVRSEADERLVLIEILATRGRPPRDLVVELLGNQWNALVVERPSGTLRHVLIRREAPRPARVGGIWTPPLPSVREGALVPISLHRWLEILEPVPPPDRARALVASVAWTSPLNAAALVDADPDPAFALEKGHALWTSLAFGEAPVRPVLREGEGGAQPYPWPLPGAEGEPVSSLLEAFGAVAGDSLKAGEGSAGPPGAAEARLPPPELLAALESARDARLRLVTHLRSQLDALEDEGALRGAADLLLARLRQVPPGASHAVVEGFDGAEVTLELDPALSAQGNADALHDRASRAARARERLPGLVRDAEHRAASMGALLRRARSGEATADELRAFLPAREERGAPEGGKPLPYRVFRSSGGLEIRVGRGARFNDDLTFHHTAPGDVWLHARHAAGAHVVLRWGKPGNPPARDLEEAAILAALHSKARTSGVVPVDWTLRKHVRKPRGSPPGTVLPDRVKTVMARPDAALLEKLAVDP